MSIELVMLSNHLILCCPLFAFKLSQHQGLFLYFDVPLTGECMPDVDGAQFFAGKEKEER